MYTLYANLVTFLNMERIHTYVIFNTWIDTLLSGLCFQRLCGSIESILNFARLRSKYSQLGLGLTRVTENTNTSRAHKTLILSQLCAWDRWDRYHVEKHNLAALVDSRAAT